MEQEDDRDEKADYLSRSEDFSSCPGSSALRPSRIICDSSGNATSMIEAESSLSA